MSQIIIVDKESTNQRIDSYLSSVTDYSRSKIAIMIKDKKILCNNSVTKANYKVIEGDIISVGDYIPKTDHIEAVAMDLSIIYEDEEIIVVDKPRGLAVHAGKGIYTPTLINGLYNHIKPLKPGLVHRIDKNTSGLLAVAKNDKSHNALALQLLDKTMRRHYLAIVDGVIDKTITINAPIAVDSSDSKKMCIDFDSGKSATTIITPIKSSNTHSLIKCELLTGRTHQIRIHLAHIGHPLVEDNIYNKKYPDGSGQYLFAYHLEFMHPISNNFVAFDAPVPDYFKTKLKELDLE